MNSARWTGHNIKLISKFTNNMVVIRKNDYGYNLYLNTVNGFRVIAKGEWISKTKSGEFEINNTSLKK
ncbi:MAG TPA: hypothetical protein QF753_07275 [Victivallales bacterium]|nr:hypothetical protein [Victivallales bacterium]|tara:strand:- start:533 stop:736 length:204 start_codon:yes stop_codon:yes gene_type:complete